VRQEARMEFRNVDTVRLGGGKIVAGFIQDPHGVTTQKTPFFIVTAVKTSNLTYISLVFVTLILCFFSIALYYAIRIVQEF
jgi:hypothetical protein